VRVRFDIFPERENSSVPGVRRCINSGAERMTHAVTGEQTPPYSEQIACGNV
jgi:hypothetical protein